MKCERIAHGLSQLQDRINPVEKIVVFKYMMDLLIHIVSFVHMILFTCQVLLRNHVNRLSRSLITCFPAFLRWFFPLCYKY